MSTQFHLPLFAFIAALLVVGCAKSAKEPAPAESAAKPAEPESRVKHGTNGEVIITLDAGTQKGMGLQTSALETAQLNPEVKAYGHVLDAAPLASLVAELAMAQAASDASQAELKRLKTLARENNASARALESEDASAARDQAQVESARLRLVSGWGKAIAGRQDLPALVKSLSALESVLVELDVPAGEAIDAAPTRARVLTLAEGSKPIEAELLGPATTVDAQMQGRGFLCLVATNQTHLAPGAAVTGFLSLPGEPKSGVAVPRDAVVRFNGATWVYVQTGDDTFERKEAALDRPLEKGWFVQEGLKPQDKVVTTGGQQLLSEELKGQVE
jgi:multidrug efflux pump subunit AcrA (membrane-fusion protein)